MEGTSGEVAREVYTINQAADSLGVSTKTIRNWIKRGTLQAFKLGGSWRIRGEEVDRLLKRPRKEAREDLPDVPYGGEYGD